MIETLCFSETVLCQQIATLLTTLTSTNSLIRHGSPVFWYKVRNEFTGAFDGVYGARMKREGVRAGVLDYTFQAKDWSGCMEVKSPKGKLSVPQQAVCDTLQIYGIDFAVVRSLEDVLKTLSQWEIR